MAIIPITMNRTIARPSPTPNWYALTGWKKNDSMVNRTVTIGSCSIVEVGVVDLSKTMKKLAKIQYNIYM